jgi:hypothetical protein
MLLPKTMFEDAEIGRAEGNRHGRHRLVSTSGSGKNPLARDYFNYPA